MQPQRPVEKPGAGAAGAVLLEGPDTGLNDLRVRGQTQIIVRAEHDPAFALHDDLGILSGLQRVEIWINTHFLYLIGNRRLKAFLKNVHTVSFLRAERFYSSNI